MQSTSTDELVTLCRGFLLNAAARANAMTTTAPPQPSPDYLSGFAAGREAGEVGALSLVLSMLGAGSATALAQEAEAHASVDAAVPFELHLEEVSS